MFLHGMKTGQREHDRGDRKPDERYRVRDVTMTSTVIDCARQERF